jgi:hypothetical protein
MILLAKSGIYQPKSPLMQKKGGHAPANDCQKMANFSKLCAFFALTTLPEP